MDRVVVHYAEIGLKGKNREYFEKLLVNNMKAKLGKLFKSYLRESGQITLELSDFSKAKDILSKIPGIAFFSFAKRCSLEVDTIKKCVVEVLKNKEFNTFKINAKRHNKEVKLSSMELNNVLGQVVVDVYKKKAKMKNQDIAVKVELVHKNAYISLEDIKGVGGMPTNQKQKVVSLMSGGFDSPVASYLMMKRGCEVVLVHFQNKSQMKDSVEDKIIRLAKQLSKFQQKTKLYIIPFEKIQKEIIAKTQSTMRMLVYRKFMIKIASKIAKIEKARFLVVGDSLSQVASQTLENLEATYKDSDVHIFSPLIGMDKDEIVKIARKINTFDISALPYGDCCSYFLPKHPILKARAGMLKKEQEKFDVDVLVDGAVEKVNVVEM